MCVVDESFPGNAPAGKDVDAASAAAEKVVADRASAEQRKERAQLAAAIAAADAAPQPIVAARPRTLASLRNKPKVCIRMRAVTDFSAIVPQHQTFSRASPTERTHSKSGAKVGAALSSAEPSKNASASTAHGESSARASAPSRTNTPGVSSPQPRPAEGAARQCRSSARPSTAHCRSITGGGSGGVQRVQSRDCGRPQALGPAQKMAVAVQQNDEFDEFAELGDESEASDAEDFEMALALESDAEADTMGGTDDGADHLSATFCAPGMDQHRVVLHFR